MTNRYALSQINEIRIEPISDSNLFACVITYRQVDRSFWDGGIDTSWCEIFCGGSQSERALEYFNDRQKQQSMGFTFGVGRSPFLALAAAEPDEDYEV